MPPFAIHVFKNQKGTKYGISSRGKILKVSRKGNWAYLKPPYSQELQSKAKKWSVQCSKKKKAKCTDPCEWHKGKCRKPKKKILRPASTVAKKPVLVPQLVSPPVQPVQRLMPILLAPQPVQRLMPILLAPQPVQTPVVQNPVFNVPIQGAGGAPSAGAAAPPPALPGGPTLTAKEMKVLLRPLSTRFKKLKKVDVTTAENYADQIANKLFQKEDPLNFVELISNMFPFTDPMLKAKFDSFLFGEGSEFEGPDEGDVEFSWDTYFDEGQFDFSRDDVAVDLAFGLPDFQVTELTEQDRKDFVKAAQRFEPKLKPARAQAIFNEIKDELAALQGQSGPILAQLGAQRDPCLDFVIFRDQLQMIKDHMRQKNLDNISFRQIMTLFGF